MNIALYQINMDRDNDRVCFMAHDKLQQFQGSGKVNSEIYDKVFDGYVNCSSLEDVYRMFNLSIPEEYRGRSLSVSDIVEIRKPEKEESEFYFCDSYGFKKVEFNPEKAENTLAEPEEKESSNTISVLLVQPGKRPRLITTDDSLESMQGLVGGMIEEYMPFEDDVAIICNEEGKMNGLPLNRAIYDDNHNMIDIIAGDFFIAYAPIESENFLSLPKDLADKYSKEFQDPERFIRMEDEIKAVPMKPAREEKER